MNTINRLWNIVARLSVKPFFNRILSDKAQIRLGYRGFVGRPLDLKHSKRFTEKMQSIKLSPWLRQQSHLTDKWQVRQYVARRIGTDHLIPLYGISDSATRIRPDLLPESFALKYTHDSGSVILFRQNEGRNWPQILRRLSRYGNKDYYHSCREGNYASIRPRILFEKLLLETDGQPPEDYKIYCFHGTPAFIQVDTGRFTQHRRVMYGTNWQKQPFNICFPLNDLDVKRPEQLNDMLKLATRLAADIPFVRVDLYVHGGTIYFGELTFVHGAGYEPFYPDTADEEAGARLMLGDWIHEPTGALPDSDEPPVYVC